MLGFRRSGHICAHIYNTFINLAIHPSTAPSSTLPTLFPNANHITFSHKASSVHDNTQVQQSCNKNTMIP